MLGSRRSRWHRRARTVVAALLGGTIALGSTGLGPPVGAAPTAPAQELPTDPGDLLELAMQVLDALVPDDVPDPVDVLDPLNPACDPLDVAMCLLPFPSDRWTVADPTTATGRRVELPLLGMPRNVYGKPIDPTEWNRNDGFSPGSMLLTLVPGLDLAATWGLADRPERYRDQVTDLALSLAPDAPIVLVDAETGERHPFLSELDGHPDTPPGARTLIVRPAVNLLEGHRYVIGLRRLLRADGREIDAGAAFAALRDGTAGGPRQAHYDDAIFPVLDDAGVAREQLVLAWDLTVASADNLAGRALAMRDQAFAALGDTDLADGVVAGVPPVFTIDSVERRDDPDDATARVVRGTVEVPNYLTFPAEATVEIPDLGAFPVPGARLVYDTPTPGPRATPVVNPLAPTRDVPFVCSVPRAATPADPATPTLYGHGLLGSRNESTGSSTRGLREHGYMPCAVDWTGMATGDLPNIVLMLQDLSFFPSLADRAQQGFVDFLVLGRALAHPTGLVTDPAFRDRGAPLFDPAGLVYDGNSQGAIMGGALTALGVDFTRAVLGVPGMNYSTLLNRSLDWEGAYGELSYAFYPTKLEQQLMFALIQMLWDRGEANGFAQHMTDDPLPGSPAKQVLLQLGFGDHQVTNLAAEVEGRTIGAHRIPTDLPVCRHWARDPMFGFPENDPTEAHPAVLAYFDSGTPRGPNDNRPSALGDDPHGDPRSDPAAIEQKLTFYETGRVVDVAGGGHARTQQWPEAAGAHLDAVLAEARAAPGADAITGCASEGAPVPTAPAPSAPALTRDGEPGGSAAVRGGTTLPATGGTTGAPATVALLLVAATAGLHLVRRSARPGPPRDLARI